MDSNFVKDWFGDNCDPLLPQRVVIECDGEFYSAEDVTVDEDGDVIIKTGGPL